MTRKAQEDFAPLQAVISAAANGTRTLVAAPGANKQIWVYTIAVRSSAAGTVTFLDSSPTNLTGAMNMSADHMLSVGSANPNAPWFKCASNKAFQVTLDTNIALGGFMLYAIVPVSA